MAKYVEVNKTFKNMFAKGESVNIGSIHGFPITAKYQKDLLSGTVFVQATIHGAAKHTVDFGSAAHHNLRRLEGVFTSFEKILSEAQDRLNRLDVDMKESKKLLNVPFDRKQELEDKSERMNELRDILHKEAQNKGSNKQRTYYSSLWLKQRLYSLLSSLKHLNRKRLNSRIINRIPSIPRRNKNTKLPWQQTPWESF